MGLSRARDPLTPLNSFSHYRWSFRPSDQLLGQSLVVRITMPWPVTARITIPSTANCTLRPFSSLESRRVRVALPFSSPFPSSSSSSKSCTTIINNGRVISASIIRHFSLFPPPSVINRVGNYWKLRGAIHERDFLLLFFLLRSENFERKFRKDDARISDPHFCFVFLFRDKFEISFGEI